MIAVLFAVFQRPSVAGFILVVSKASLPISTAFSLEVALVRKIGSDIDERIGNHFKQGPLQVLRIVPKHLKIATPNLKEINFHCTVSLLLRNKVNSRLANGNLSSPKYCLIDNNPLMP